MQNLPTPLWIFVYVLHYSINDLLRAVRANVNVRQGTVTLEVSNCVDSSFPCPAQTPVIRPSAAAYHDSGNECLAFVRDVENEAGSLSHPRSTHDHTWC